MTNRAVFIDRDGTMAKDVHYCSRPEDFELFPNTAKGIRLLNKKGFKVIVITNQSGIARGYFTRENLAKIHEKMERELAEEGARVDAIYYCPHHPDDGCDCRKPKPMLVLQAAREHDIDLSKSFVVGDLRMDVELGRMTGCKSILISHPSLSDAQEVKPDAVARDVLEAAKIVLEMESARSEQGRKHSSGAGT